MKPIVLDIDNLVVGLGKNPANQRVIDGVSLQVREGETLCLVGESGSGKSVTSLTVMGLLQKGSLVPSGGTVKLVGEEILTASDRRLRQLRATTMAMIFQEPITALNPVVPVGRQIDEVLRAHTDLDARTRKQRIGHVDRAGVRDRAQHREDRPIRAVAEDDRRPRGPSRGHPAAGGVDTAGRKRLEHEPAERVVADNADHRDPEAEPGGPAGGDRG